MKQATIGIVDYGMGNLGSVRNALDFLGARWTDVCQAEQLTGVDALLLPGVGAFGQSMHNLRSRGLDEAMTEHVRVRGKPFFGICLGMQMLAEDSLELGHYRGLGWIPGHVLPLSHEHGVRVPHVGWTPVRFRTNKDYFTRNEEGAAFYFDHSYHMQCDPAYVAATADYAGRIVVAVRHENIFATQFHPEKSQRNGLKLLRDFVNFCQRA